MRNATINRKTAETDIKLNLNLDVCEKGVIKIKQTMPMRKDLHEYFRKDYNLDIKLWNNDNE